MYWMMGGFSGIDWRYGWMMLVAAQLPIGVVTATLGAPLFIALLIKSSR
nr:glutathione peroxidase [Candidatus Pantoea persica]